MIGGAIGGTMIMAGIYFLGEYFGAALGWGGPAQAVTELPFNLLQNVVGAPIAIPLCPSDAPRLSAASPATPPGRRG